MMVLHGAWLKEQVPGARPCLFLWGELPGLAPGAVSAQSLRRQLAEVNRAFAYMGLLTEAVAFFPPVDHAEEPWQGRKIPGLYLPPEEAGSVFGLLRAAWRVQSALTPDGDYVYWDTVYAFVSRSIGVNPQMPLRQWVLDMPDSACHIVSCSYPPLQYAPPDKRECLSSFISAMGRPESGNTERGSGAPPVFCTCLRLEEPETQEGAWRLSYWLYPAEDPSLLLSAAVLPEMAADPASYGYKQLPALRAQLLQDLAAAVRFC